MIKTVSLVICTHRREKLLKGALESLSNQTAGKDEYEVIVVDNDTKENPEIQKTVHYFKSKISVFYLITPYKES